VSIDIPWTRAELAQFLKLTEFYRQPDPSGVFSISNHLSNRGKQSGSSPAHT
jgi:hypothetical protein